MLRSLFLYIIVGGICLMFFLFALSIIVRIIQH